MKTRYLVALMLTLPAGALVAGELGTGSDIPDAIPGQSEASSAGFIESLLMWFDVGNHSED